MGNSSSSSDNIGSSRNAGPEHITSSSATSTTSSAAANNPSKNASSPSSDPAAAGSHGNFHPSVTLQTLGSAPAALDDGASTGYNYHGVGPGGYANPTEGIPSIGGDSLAFSIGKDLNPSTIGGQIVGMQRLWPGSGRMMRSYRLRIRVPRMNATNSSGSIDSGGQATTESLPFTIELACKSFIVRSEKGENPLRLTLAEGDAELKRLRTLLADPVAHPHILSYGRWIIGPLSTMSNAPASPSNNIVARPIHLLRQHVHASLSDRLVSRPFLTLIEKNWIAYQLLNAIQSLHDVGVCHGHITAENVLLTSWNWVLISDVGCQHYKPVSLPDDDPGLWIHWFEGRAGEDRKTEHHHSSSYGEKKCYLAPERFYTPGKSAEVPTKLTPAMDTFSLGCVLIELFLNGERALDLGDLMEYRRLGEKQVSSLPQSLKQKLDKIESSKMRAACRHMLSLDPSSRLFPSEYLDRLSSDLSKKTIEAGETSTCAPIPQCFKTTLLPFMLRVRAEINSPDVRIALVACNYSSILKATVGVHDEWGAAYFSRVLGPTIRRFEKSLTPSNIPERMEEGSIGEHQARCAGYSSRTLDELLFETEDLLRKLDSGYFNSTNLQDYPQQDLLSPVPQSKPQCLVDRAIKFVGASSHSTPSQASIIIILQVVFSSARHVRRSSSKYVALKLIHRIALFSSDEIRLQRIVPFVMSLLQDSEPIVRASGISVLASVLSIVTTFPPSDAQLFPRYVFKKVAHLITDASLMVRVAFAKNIASLSETSLRFLDIGHSVSLYDAVSGTKSQDKHAKQDEKVPVFSEETANLLGKGAFPDKKAPITAHVSRAETSTILIRNTYDSDLAVLHEVVLRWVVHITTDTSDHSSQLKEALLCELPRLCNFFGAEYSFQILPQILAFFNDRKDWQLRASLCRHLPSVCVAVGRAATEQFVVPCIESALNDDEELVVNEALACLSTLISTSLLTRTSLLGTEARLSSSQSDGRPPREKQGVIMKSAALLLHPIDAVRKNAASFIFLCFRDLGDTDTHAFASNILRPYLKYRPTFESLHNFINCLKTSKPYLRSLEAESKTRVITSNINAEMDFSVKLARSISVPNQWCNESTSSSIPPWYESLMKVASANSNLSDPRFSLGITAYEQVYGIRIPVASNTHKQQMMTWIEGNNLSRIATENEESIVNLLLRQEFTILESSCRGEWGSFALIDQFVPENWLVLSKIHALSVPPLPPHLGQLKSGYDVDIKMNPNWTPKEDTLLAATSSTTEHSGPVTRLAVSADQAFFVSASSDGTSRVFEIGQTKETGGDLRSCLTYDGHISENKSSCYLRINDVSILENSHSVASAASDGSLHVWRIDTVTSLQSSSSAQTIKTRVSGNSVLRRVNPCEGEVMAVSHFNTSSASILTYATQRGAIHSMDLRCPNEPFSLRFGPEYGYLTSLEVGKERGWIVAGTSRGYIGLFDIRFQSMMKLWRHSRDSPVKRLANACDAASRPLLFMGSDNNEALLFDASTGECRQCYRVLEGSLSYIDQTALPLECLSMPYLENVAVGKPVISLGTALLNSTSRSSTFSINALIGRINQNGPSHLITGGSDNMIRFWDLGRSSKSFCVTGLSRNQPPPCFDHMDVGRTSRLYICQQPPVLPPRLMESNKVPSLNRQGVVRCDNRHTDSILDLKIVNYPSTCLLSSSRDGTIKMWS